MSLRMKAFGIQRPRNSTVVKLHEFTHSSLLTFARMHATEYDEYGKVLKFRPFSCRSREILPNQFTQAAEITVLDVIMGDTPVLRTVPAARYYEQSRRTEIRKLMYAIVDEISDKLSIDYAKHAATLLMKVLERGLRNA